MNIVEAIKESWGWIGIDPDEIVDQNDFGNLIIRDKAGKYWRLCPEDTYCKVIAENRHELDELSASQEFLIDWNMVQLTEHALEKYGQLQSGCKYHLTIPSVLGGTYDLTNIRVVSHKEQISFSGDIAKQINELPDGSRIALRVIE